jgi:UDP-3-O-[3-hydroxymyristoyl] glucosamine N-acyltransferase
MTVREHVDVYDVVFRSDGSAVTVKRAPARVHPSAQVHPTATIHPSAVIGPGCIIGPGAVIGSTGFGYERQPDGTWEPKPHEFGVILDEDVHVGANTCIDRGSWRDTRIGRGTRIDNLCHLAHNVRIGRDVCIVAQAMIAGSVEIHDGAWVGPSASIHQRLTVGPRALVGMGAVVLKDVAANTTVAGVPARVIDSTQGVREAM